MSIAEKLTTIAENIPKVYEAGKSAGGYEQGFEDGKQAEYDAFWDSCQDYGNKTYYEDGFRGGSWNDTTFKPKYDFKITNATCMFYGSQMTEINKTLDLSECEGNKVNTMFAYSAIVTIKDIIVNETLLLSASFRACYGLTTLGIRGTIGQDISFNWSSMLSNESVNNVINCLKDLTGQTARTVDFHSNIVTKLTDEQILQIDNKNWSVI